MIGAAADRVDLETLGHREDQQVNITAAHGRGRDGHARIGQLPDPATDRLSIMWAAEVRVGTATLLVNAHDNGSAAWGVREAYDRIGKILRGVLERRRRTLELESRGLEVAPAVAIVDALQGILDVSGWCG